jgi:hypothetical protein
MIFKRFLLFAGRKEFPKGGMKDFVGSYRTPQEAIGIYLKMKDPVFETWVQIFDSVRNRYVDHTDGGIILYTDSYMPGE